MSAESQSTDLQELTRTLSVLAEALARSERRHAHLVRGLRWAALTLVALVAGGGYLAADRIGLAHAQAGQPGACSTQPGGSQLDALNNIHCSLTEIGRGLGVFAQMADKLGGAMPVIEYRMMTDEAVLSGVEQFIVDGRAAPEVQQALAAAVTKYQDDPERGAKIRQAVTEAKKKAEDRARAEPMTMQELGESFIPAVATSGAISFVDAVVLMARIRQDSNAFRSMIEGPNDALKGLRYELQLMNGALAAVPGMAAQMDFMNRNMATMSHSMGSTMGRMGSWMP